MASASLSDASLFMDMDLFKEEEDATLQTACMDFPTSSLELVQLLACEDDMFMDATASDDVFTCHDSNTNDDFSDAVTDDASSDMASPPPTFADDDTSHSPPSSPAVYGFACNVASTPSSGGAMPPCVLTPKTPPSPSTTASTVSSPMPTPSAPPLAPSTTTVTPVPPTAMLPFAFPVACFPPLNVNLKRPLPDVLPNQPAANLDPVEVKKSKRALRQMKNRESANRSRLRRKAQLSDLSGEVEELTKKQHELQNTIAALQAENKSLHDQNAFLRSLVTMYSDPTRAAALPPVPSAATSAAVHETMRPTASLSELESGSKSMTESMLDDVFDEDEDEDDVMTLPTPKKQRKSLGRSAATVSAASLGLCASMFGLTILTDSENAAAQSSHIRRPGRVLHSLPSTTDQGCTPSTMMSFVERLWETFTSSLEFLTTSDLAYGVFLNVLSFVVIMGLYHCFQQYVYTPRSSQRTFRWQNVQHRRVSNAAATQAKRRSVSWQDVRVEAQKAADNEANTSMPRVEIFM